MTDQELRLECLSLAVEAGACPDHALDVAADFEAFVRGRPIYDRFQLRAAVETGN